IPRDSETLSAQSLRRRWRTRTFAGEPIPPRSADHLYRFAAMSTVSSPRLAARTWTLAIGGLLFAATFGVANAQQPAPPRRPTAARRLPTPSLGIFQGTTNVGRPSVVGAGAARFDTRSRSYEVTGGGANMWGTADHFRYVWLRVSGDVALEAAVRFTDSF